MPTAKRKYTVIIERDEDNWLVSEVIELPGCHTQGRTLDELLDRTREAIQVYVESEHVEATGEFVGVQRIEV